MAVSKVQEASPSVSRCIYHVFLSFRGADTRKNFTDHLYTALVQAGIHTFRDDEEIERGKNIKEEIEKAMLHKSKISIIVFSKDYASSTWCLDELVKILEHRNSSQHIVLPVFYDVDPTLVKKQTGSYAEAFARHVESFKSEMGVVQRWRAALNEVADLGGMVLQDRHESQFIQDIVKEVQNRLHRNALYVPPYLVGIDSLVTRINWWLKEDGSTKVGIATICGIGGIGKTTIAKVVYNQNIQRFEGYSFLANVRETSQEHNGLVRLQRQLISDILKGKAQKIYTADDGINKIRKAICCRRILLVLDDVDDLEKLAKLIGSQILFHPKSKIIITSRHRNLLNASFIGHMFDLEASSSYGDISKVFEVKELAYNESLQLFNWYAFGPNSINDSFMDCASSVVKHCGGLPLALQVLGSSLSGKSTVVWKSALQKLEAITDSKIEKILRISYDSLEDDYDKDLFLDIACSFIGKDKDYTTTILDGCGYYTTIGIENLIGNSLLMVNERNKLMMHQLVRDMGREIIRQESPNLGKRSRLWHRDAFDVIRQKIGSKTIKCLTVDLQRLQENFGRTTASLHFAEYTKNPFLRSNEADMEIEAFAKMQKLKLLQLDYVKLKGDFKNFPKGLIWLRWHGFPLRSLPKGFDIRRLVVLDLRNSNLKHVWKDTECIPNLKILNLNHSHFLLKTPNFSRLPSLEKLLLKDCIKLIEVNESIGELQALTFLSLKDCRSLIKLPRTIGSLVSLEELILSGCSRLDDVPRELHNMKSLRVLNLDETAMYQSRTCLSWLSLKRSKALDFFWTSLPCSLVKLSLESCRIYDDVMPNDLSGLPFLKCLNLSRNPLRSLPESIRNLKMLDELLLTSCKELQVIPKFPILISPFIELYVALSPITIGLSSLSCLMSFKKCIIFGCEKLIEVEGVFKMEAIEKFEGEQVRNLFNIDVIERNKVQIFNYLTDTKIVGSPQVIQECGITSMFVTGSEVPICFEHRNKGPQIVFSLRAPSDPSAKIIWFTLCIILSLVNDQIFEYLPCVYITNETKEVMRAYFSSFIGVPDNNNSTMMWLIHWPIIGFQLENGDSLSCTVVSNDLIIREVGVTCGSENNSITCESSCGCYHPGNEERLPRNVESELTKELLNLDSYGNEEVQIYNHLEESKTVASPQVLHDCGIISEFDSSKSIPLYRYGHHAPRPKISFTVPPNYGQKSSCWLKSIIILSGSNDKTFDFLPLVEIVNETKGVKWSHGKHFIGIPETKTTIITWLSCWKFTEELEAGDCVSLTVHSDLLLIDSGIDFLYDYETMQKDHLLDQYMQATTKCYSRFVVRLRFLMFRLQRTLYRMSLVKE